MMERKRVRKQSRKLSRKVPVVGHQEKMGMLPSQPEVRRKYTKKCPQNEE
jgi:hypothetical protein